MNPTYLHNKTHLRLRLNRDYTYRTPAIFWRMLTYKNVGCIVSLVPDTGSSTGKGSHSDLVKVISNLIGLKDLSTFDPPTTPGSLGIDSLIAVEIKQRIEHVMGFSLSFKEVRDLTVSNLQQFVNNRDLLQVSNETSNEESKEVSNQTS